MNLGSKIHLGNLIPQRNRAINPVRFHDEVFDLYSIPSHDCGKPDVLHGSEIGSAKQIVQPGDVLLSKIVPHIRRCWVVGPDSGRRQIASGEWIVFRHSTIHQEYLRHFLLSDGFHSRFMQTVSGVGGSLLRARPAEVAKIAMELPPPSEQRRIAAILDKADAIRRRRQALLKDSDELIRAAFLKLLEGLPGRRVSIEELLPETPNTIRTGPFGSQLLHSEFTETGIPVLGIDNVVTNRFRWAERRYVSAEKYQELRRYRVFPGDVLVTIMGTTGRVCIAPRDLPESISTKHLCTISPDRERLLPEFLWASLLWDPVVRAQAAREGKGAIMEGWNMGIVRGLLISLPTIAQQQSFAAFVRKVELLRIKYQTAELQANELFSSLVHRAFNGQL